MPSQPALACYRSALRRLMLTIPPDESPIFTRDWVLKHTPHRSPFQFIRCVQAFAGGSICGLFDADQSVYKAHCLTRGIHVWPESLQIEAMGQAGLLLYSLLSALTPSSVALGIIHRARFHRPVFSGLPINLLASSFDEGLFITVVGQTVQSGQACSACLLSCFVEEQS